jgi:sugar phosphate isomerase/epimerase
MPGTLSIREGVFGSWQNAVEYAPTAGINALEVSVRPLDQLKELAAAAEAVGVQILTLAGSVNLDLEESIDAAIQTLEACHQLQVGIFFCSATGKELDREIHMARLRNLADEAKTRGVTISLETHPPFCQNADGMLQTMRELNHPNVRINLDTANIYYYNEGLCSATELERVIDVVASVHLKDTDGGFHSPNFPVLGEGIVDFPRIRGILEAASFAGPMTIELEGPVVSGKDLPACVAICKACADFAKNSGLV